MNKHLLLLIPALLVCLGVLPPATASAQNGEQSADISGAINDNATIAQVLDLLLDCGKQPAEHALQLNPTQQRDVDIACSRTEASLSPVALGPKQLRIPCPLFLQKPDNGNATEHVLNFCATHPANVFAVGNLDGGEAKIESVDWCAMKFSQNSPPGQEKVFKFLMWAYDRAKARQGVQGQTNQNQTEKEKREPPEGAPAVAQPAAQPALTEGVPAAVEHHNTTDLSTTFQCPEDYPSVEAKQSALGNFLQAYAAQFPNATDHDVMLYRYRLLVAHSCNQTLEYMLAHLSPTTEMLRFQNQDYGPKTEEFDPTTKVWSVFYVKDGEKPNVAKEELIFNFYGWEPPTSPESIAKAFMNRSDAGKILGKFGAPDDITKSLAYFVTSETTYPDQPFAYVNISKITSAGGSAYTVTFAKKVYSTTSAEVDEKVRSWVLSEDGRVTFLAIGRVGVGAGWQEHLTNPNGK